MEIKVKDNSIFLFDCGSVISEWILNDFGWLIKRVWDIPSNRDSYKKEMVSFTLYNLENLRSIDVNNEKDIDDFNRAIQNRKTNPYGVFESNLNFYKVNNFGLKINVWFPTQDLNSPWAIDFIDINTYLKMNYKLKVDVSGLLYGDKTKLYGLYNKEGSVKICELELPDVSKLSLVEGANKRIDFLINYINKIKEDENKIFKLN